MAAPSASPVPSEGRGLDPATYWRHGVLAGLFGAVLLAAWFAIFDVLRGHPLATPTLLGRALLSGGTDGATASTVTPSLGVTLVFTAVHALAFAAIGLAVAEIVRRFDLAGSRALLLVLLFGALCVAFFSFGVLFAAVGPDAITVRDAFLGNAIAAFGMAGYLQRALGGHAR